MLNDTTWLNILLKLEQSSNQQIIGMLKCSFVISANDLLYMTISVSRILNVPPVWYLFLFMLILLSQLKMYHDRM